MARKTHEPDPAEKTLKVIGGISLLGEVLQGLLRELADWDRLIVYHIEIQSGKTVVQCLQGLQELIPTGVLEEFDGRIYSYRYVVRMGNLELFQLLESVEGEYESD